ncbi:spermine oxidase [Trichonephila clavata]|uniref:Spermine oxidase n=1 Tax=Trichonephila clavata TaxID=2740835 RepID=A0A8X6J159_TRICU|nr:spermine oxidase [Trichonephila clavata]
MQFDDCCVIENDKIFEKRVIIIGAGISGLACGCSLKRLGFKNVKILEARSRIGGRIHGINLGSKYIEMGAQWIHGQTDNVIYKIAESKGLVDKDAFNYVDAIKSFTNFDNDEKIALIELFDFLEDKVNNFSGDCNPSSLLTFANEQFQIFLSQFGPCNFSDFLNEGFEWYCKNLSELNGCQNLSTLSVNLLNNYKECEGNQVVEVKNGLSSLLNVFLEVLHPDWIFKNKLVTKIDWSDFKVEFNEQNFECKSSLKHAKSNKEIRIICQGGEIFRADHVVITIPLGCLKKYSESLFIPSLCNNKLKAIHCLGFGAINKVYLEFEEIFWESNAIFNVLWQKLYDDEFLKEASVKPYTYCWLKYVGRFAYTPNHPNLLCAWVTGEGAVLVESLSDDEIVGDCMKLLRLILGKEIPVPSRIYRSSWMSDPLSCGSYSYLSVDCEKENVTNLDLAEPEYSDLPCSKV